MSCAGVSDRSLPATREGAEPHIRRTTEVILWRHQNGATWRSLSAEFGLWWMAAQTGLRWAWLGVWEKLLALVQERGVRLGMVFLDGTNIRAPEGGRYQSKGGLRKSEWAVKRLAALVAATAPRPLAMADGQGRAIAFRLAPGQAHELPHAIPLLDRMPDVPKWVVADRGYTSHAVRQHIWGTGAWPAISPQQHEAPVACPDWIYNNRNRVERLWARLKEWRAIATWLTRKPPPAPLASSASPPPSTGLSPNRA